MSMPMPMPISMSYILYIFDISTHVYVAQADVSIQLAEQEGRPAIDSLAPEALTILSEALRRVHSGGQGAVERPGGRHPEASASFTLAAKGQLI